MTGTEVERLAWSVWELFGQGRLEEALALLDDDGVYWVAGGRRDEIRMADMKDYFRTTAPLFTVAFTKRSWFVSGERVVLELDGHAHTPNGVYANVYCFVMTVRDGKVVRIHEYLDTALAATVLAPVVGEALRALRRR
jgi:ketosteroid isomerase-like protein